jgi:type I restriction enzyme M protein
MAALEVKRDEEKGKIWSHIRKKWLQETPEETVRQEYLCSLVNEYGFGLDQIDEELEVTGRGSGHARADFVIWRSAKDKADSNNPLIIIECKSDNVTIKPADYGQGDNYARLAGARFFVTHNSRETKFWRVIHEKMPKSLEEISNVPHADASNKEIEELLSKLKVFKEEEFADLLHQCHNVIRNREKLDPAAAFDEIAKILFVKVFVERELKAKRQRKNLFNVEYLDDQLGKHPINTLFQQTKEAYEDDKIFEPDEEIRLRPATGREIVKLLERYNLSDTSEDIKGIAFERFLGRTFRGEIGQFFTPRTIVEFMIRMIEPKEGEIICDPASGSGGFLIRFFEIVREQILADADKEYQSFKKDLETQGLPEDKMAESLRKKYAEIQVALDQRKRDSRLWKLANRCVYGTDANDRMARTSKMNMIMHGDGHAGVHHHDGFLNVNGIFEGRFDIILTNPPFGASVEPSDVVHESDVTTDHSAEKRYTENYGDLYTDALARARASIGKPIASLFELPKNEKSKIKTEILFIERCLALLKPGGRLGIVLPEGIFNNPSLAYVREFCENRSFIRAEVSLPQETFASSGASVKASLLFLQKFTTKEQIDFDTKNATARAELEAKYADEITSEIMQLETAITAAKDLGDVEQRKSLQKRLKDYQKRMADIITTETRALLKERFPYPIFLYEAEKVGITATGDSDQNQLIPNDKLPTTCTTSCLEDYKKFQINPEEYLLQTNVSKTENVSNRIAVLPPTPRRGAFALTWKDFERWDTFFYREDFFELERQLSKIKYAQLGDILTFESRSWKPENFPSGQFRYIEISSVTKEDGITKATLVDIKNAPSRATTLIKEGDIILSTTRPYLGAFAVVTKAYDNCVCSSGFSLATGLRMKDIDINYLLLFLKSEAGLRQMERRMTGGLYPAIVQGELEKIKVPILPIIKQKEIVAAVDAGKTRILIELENARRKAEKEMAALDALILNILPNGTTSHG